MKIADIQNKRVKISSHSITVKDERDKTCGVVRDVKPYRELRPAAVVMVTSSRLKNVNDMSKNPVDLKSSTIFTSLTNKIE